MDQKKAGKKANRKLSALGNVQLPSGVWKLSKSLVSSAKARSRSKKEKAPLEEKAKPLPNRRFLVKEVKGEKNGGQRLVKLVKERRFYPTEDKPRYLPSRKRKFFSQHVRSLKKSITPGTVLILLAGPHKGKRVVFLKQLATGLLLVTGPYKYNRCPMRRINQIYTIGTKTKVDLSGVAVPEHVDDKYFRRQVARKSKKESMFEEKSKEYVLSDQRKQDQISVDTQLVAAIKNHPDGVYLKHYLKARFSLRNGKPAHELIF